MAKSKETSNKKDKEKKRLKRIQDKRERMEERKQTVKKGKSLDEMMAYIDENGNLSDTPPDPRRMKQFKSEDIPLKIVQNSNDGSSLRTGTVTFFDAKKGFGFIIDDASNDKIFVHVNELEEPIAAEDSVTYEIQRGNRGLSAVGVKKIN